MADARDWSACAWPLSADVQLHLRALKFAEGRQAPASEAERALATAGARLRVARAEHEAEVQARTAESKNASLSKPGCRACCSAIAAGGRAARAAKEAAEAAEVLREARADLDALEPAGSAAQRTAMALFGGPEPEPQPLTVEAAEVALRQAEAALLKPSLLAAAAQDGNALQYASAELRADKEVVLAAVAQNGCALPYASAELRANKEVVPVCDE